MHKPSILWPPPGVDHSHQIRQGIRHRLRNIAGLNDQGRFKSFLGSKGRTPLPNDGPVAANHVVDTGKQMDLGATTSAPSVIGGQDQGIALGLEDGKTLNVDTQVQFYATNDLLYHPLISHCRAYLGGLPPLFFIAGDKEVLRDEIIYTWVSPPPILTCR
jgi:acetyl esterase/lipase